MFHVGLKVAAYIRNMSPKYLTDSFVTLLIIYVAFVDGNIPLYITTQRDGLY